MRPHGTRARAERHRNHCEAPCPPCAAAERDYHRQQYLWAQARAFAARSRDTTDIQEIAK